MQLDIKPIWIEDEDGFMQVRLSLMGNGRQAWGEVYCYPDIFAEFGTKLINFPDSVSDEVKLELGSPDTRYAEHLLLRAFVYDGTGHCAIEFKAITRGDALATSSVQFAVPTEAATLNNLGQALLAWSSTPKELFTFRGMCS